MSGNLDEGANILREDLGTVSNTQADGAMTGTTQSHTIVDVIVQGSDVKVQIDREVV